GRVGLYERGDRFVQRQRVEPLIVREHLRTPLGVQRRAVRVLNGQLVPHRVRLVGGVERGEVRGESREVVTQDLGACLQPGDVPMPGRRQLTIRADEIEGDVDVRNVLVGEV